MKNICYISDGQGTTLQNMIIGNDISSELFRAYIDRIKMYNNIKSDAALAALYGVTRQQFNVMMKNIEDKSPLSAGIAQRFIKRINDITL